MSTAGGGNVWEFGDSVADQHHEILIGAVLPAAGERIEANAVRVIET